MTGAQMHYPEFDADSRRKHHRAAGPVAGTVSALFPLFGRMRGIDLHKLPENGPAIIVAYHASYLDPLAVGLTLWRRGMLPRYLAKSGLFTGMLGRILQSIGQIPVLRESANAGESLQYAEAALRAGEVVVIYPQGTLTKDPDLWPQAAKTGAARLALRTGAPLIPMSHWGLDAVMPVGAKVPTPKPGNRIEVLVGDPIDYSDLADDRAGIAALSERITAHVALGVARLRGVELPERFAAALAPKEHR